MKLSDLIEVYYKRKCALKENVFFQGGIHISIQNKFGVVIKIKK